MFLMLQQYDLSITVFLKIYSISYYCSCNLRGLFPFMKLSISTTYQGPNRYFPSHSTKVYSLYRDSKKGGAIISFSIITKCSQVLSYWGTGSSGIVSLSGVLMRTKILSTIFSQPLQMVLLVYGSMNFQLSSVKYLGVYVTKPNSLSSAYLAYLEGCQFQSRLTDRPLIIIASTILQLSFMPYKQFFSSVSFTVYPLVFVYSSDFKTLSLKPFYQYSSIKEVLRSIIEQRLALYILSKQSVMVVGCIRQQLITLSGRQPQDSWQVLRFTPQSTKGIFTFFANSMRISSCLFRRSSSLCLSESLASSLLTTVQTEQMPPSAQWGLLISGRMLSSPLASLVIFQRLLLLVSAKGQTITELALQLNECMETAILASFLIFLLIIILQ